MGKYTAYGPYVAQAAVVAISLLCSCGSGNSNGNDSDRFGRQRPTNTAITCSAFCGKETQYWSQQCVNNFSCRADAQWGGNKMSRCINECAEPMGDSCASICKLNGNFGGATQSDQRWANQLAGQGWAEWKDVACDWVYC